jgi:alkylation response protein AidB-like acyl-CoA dehydrogenase
MAELRFPPVRLPAEARAVREKVRAFLHDELEAGRFTPDVDSWGRFDPEFSRRAGRAGFIGMTWPKAYGGGEYSALSRFVVACEMLAAGAPCGAHWIADRQSGPQILRHGSELARRTLLPRIAAGECYFAIGMSEPNSGSDLASVRTRARREGDAWVIDGSKIWTSRAHQVHYLIALTRTGDPGPDRHQGLTQFIVDLKAPGVTIRPIHNLAGGHEFNEVFFDGVRVGDEWRIGEVGEGWRMVTGELAFERSGPDRFLSDYRLLTALIDHLGVEAKAVEVGAEEARAVGRLVAHLGALLSMSQAVAGLLAAGENPAVEAALVKDVGTRFEREIPEVARRFFSGPVRSGGADYFERALGRVMLHAPSYTLRGGTREILRGIIARGLGLR